MEMDPNPPSFNIPMNVGPLNLGASYASGMQAGTQVGENIGKGISSAFDVMTRNRSVDDTLKAMSQTGMLSPDAYNAVAGKALGAKESMLGMFASQWINAQAQNRELEKLGYAGNVDIKVAHAKLLDQLAANRVGGAPPGTPPNAATRTPPATPPNAATRAVTTAPNTTGAPTPGLWFGQYPTQAQTQTQAGFTVGNPYGPKETIPSGAIRATVRDPGSGKSINGFTTLDPGTGRKIFRPMPGQ